MGENESNSRPAKLPGNAPDALRQFVACTVDRVELDLAQMGWVPKPPALPDGAAPEVTLEDGWTSSSATIRVGWGFVSIGLPATIVDGQLHIDSSGLGFGIGDEIDPWVDAFNETLRAGGKQLDSFDVNGNKVTLTKKPRAAAATEAAAVATGTATSIPQTEAAPAKKKGGCLGWIIGAVVAVAAAVGLFLATKGNDDTNSVSTGESTAAASSSTTSTSTSSTTSTIAQVGQVPTEPESDLLIACGTFDPRTIDDVPDGDLDGYMLIGGNCEIDGAYLPRNYDIDGAPLSMNRDPVFVAAGSSPGWTHVQSQPDLVTGDVGQSYTSENFFIRSWSDITNPIAFFSSDCRGVLHSGAGAFGPDGMAVAEHPLFNYGGCQVIEMGAILNSGSDDQAFTPLPASALEEAGFYDVGPGERPAAAVNLEPYPQLVGPDAIDQGWSDSVQTIANFLGGTDTLMPFCNSMVEPNAVSGAVEVFRIDDPAPCPDRYWVFAAAQQSPDFVLTVEDTVTGHVATHIHPLGQVRPALADTIDLEPASALFDGRDGTPDTAIFPCGFGHVALALCPEGDAAMHTGSFVSVGIATGGPIPTDWDGTPRSYTIEFDQAAATALLDEAGWSIETTGDDRVRALLRDNSLTFVFAQEAVDPFDESGGDLSYVLTSMIDGHTTTQPDVPVVGLIRSPPSMAEIDTNTTVGEVDGEIEISPEEAIETLEAFYEHLSESVSAGDAGFSYDRLAPAVLEAYPTECPAALESFADPELSIMPIEEGPVGPWTWELPDGRSFEIPEATAVTLVLTGRGQAGTESEAHLELINGEFHWFTYCE